LGTCCQNFLGSNVLVGQFGTDAEDV